MTRRKIPKEIQKAIEKLYGDGLRDFTPEGYREALERLGPQNSTIVKRIRRKLDPWMEQWFPGKEGDWMDTLEGTRIRLALLAENIPLRYDIRRCREILGISQHQFKVTKNHPMWQEITDTVIPGGTRKALERLVVATWLYIHAQVVLGKRVRASYKRILSPEERDSAISSAKIFTPLSRIPKWLRTPNGDFSDVDPLQWAIERLMKRYGLPDHIREEFTIFFLTGNPAWLKNLTPLAVAAMPSENAELTMMIKHIREYTTKDDWDLIWTNYIRPYQKIIWSRRSMRPSGRRGVDISRLQKAVPFAKAVRELEKTPEFLLGDTDLEKVRRSVNDLKKLFAPRKLRRSPESEEKR